MTKVTCLAIVDRLCCREGNSTQQDVESEQPLDHPLLPDNPTAKLRRLSLPSES